MKIRKFYILLFAFIGFVSCNSPDYHLKKMNYAFKKASEGVSDNQGEMIKKYYYHRDKLVELGFYKKFSYQLDFPYGGHQIKELWKKIYKKYSHKITLKYKKKGNGIELLIWEKPQDIKDFEMFVFDLASSIEPNGVWHSESLTNKIFKVGRTVK